MSYATDPLCHVCNLTYDRCTCLATDNPPPVEQCDLLPCPNPWCAGEEGVSVSVHTLTGRWHICCDDCMIEKPWGDTEAEAVAAWNARPLTTRPQHDREAIARLRTTAAMLYQNALGCAQNHHGEDFSLHGMPGWLADAKAVIDEASAVMHGN